MRRAIAMLLLSMFCLPLLAMSHGGDPDARLPACCRRNGAHHCSMSAAQLAQQLDGQRLSTIRSKCPLYPHAVLSLGHHHLATHTAQPLLAEPLASLTSTQQIEAWARIAEAGARRKRGPPVVRLS